MDQYHQCHDVTVWSQIWRGVEKSFQIQDIRRFGGSR
jgi:hypothetical protein